MPCDLAIFDPTKSTIYVSHPSRDFHPLQLRTRWSGVRISPGAPYWNAKAPAASSLSGPLHSNSPLRGFEVGVATTRWWSGSSTTRARREAKRYHSPRVEPTRVARWALSRLKVPGGARLLIRRRASPRSGRVISPGRSRIRSARGRHTVVVRKFDDAHSGASKTTFQAA
jgi:hypothetical protein